MADPTTTDFFVSYTSTDVAWAEWIAWHLERAGYTTTLQAWDFRPGNNFVLAMQDASINSRRTIAVISPAYFTSPYTSAEWAAAFAEDPDGKNAKFLPVRVRKCQPPGLHKTVNYIDLVDLEPSQARLRLLHGVRSGRMKPEKPPNFPAHAQESAEAPQYPDERPRIWNVPFAPRMFEGRSDVLAKLAKQMAQVRRTTVTHTQTVHGLGGIGKTQLAARFAREHRAEYDVVWWIRAEDEATRFGDYSALATELGLPEAIEGDQNSAVRAAKAWLEQSDRWLLVLDNAPDPEAIAPLLPDGEAGHVLITSRRHADWRALGATPLQLGVWERQESIDFLMRCTDSTDRESANAIAELLGDLPLALSQATAYTNTQAISIRTYHARLVARAGDLLRKGKPIDYEHTVATTWNLTLDQLDVGSPVTRLLAVCACLAPERIPRELLSMRTGDSAQTQPGAASEDFAEDLIQILFNYALLTPANEEALDMHRLVQQVVRERQTLDAQRASVDDALALLRLAFPSDIEDPVHWPQCARLLPHALRATELAQSLDVASSRTGEVLAKCAIFLSARGEYTQAKDLSRRVLQIREDVYGADHPEVAKALGSLGSVLDELGEWPAARDAHQRALEIKLATYGRDDLEVAKTLNNLGIVRHKLGELPAARDAQERALRIKENACGPDHAQVAKTLNNLGNVLHELGELRAARDAHARALEIRQAAYGGDHPEVGKTLTNLGIVLSDLGELPSAREAQERSLAIQECAYGPDHPEVATTLGNLGNVLLALRALPEARDAQERAVKITEGSYGSDHVEVAKTLGNLGYILLELGELTTARDVVRRALAIFETSCGQTHPLTRQASDQLNGLAG